MSVDRFPVCYVIRRHGAWLIHWVGNHPGDRAEDDNFDVASSLAVAKRVAKDGARGYATNLRWEKHDSYNWWILVGVENEWEG